MIYLEDLLNEKEQFNPDELLTMAQADFSEYSEPTFTPYEPGELDGLFFSELDGFTSLDDALTAAGADTFDAAKLQKELEKQCRTTDITKPRRKGRGRANATK